MTNRADQPDGQTDDYTITYVCRYCGNLRTYVRAPTGSLPTVCPDCRSRANTERVRRWRERHPEAYKAANRRTVAQRKARKADEDKA